MFMALTYWFMARKRLRQASYHALPLFRFVAHTLRQEVEYVAAQNLIKLNPKKNTASETNFVSTNASLLRLI